MRLVTPLLSAGFMAATGTQVCSEMIFVDHSTAAASADIVQALSLVGNTVCTNTLRHDLGVDMTRAKYTGMGKFCMRATEPQRTHLDSLVRAVTRPYPSDPTKALAEAAFDYRLRVGDTVRSGSYAYGGDEDFDRPAPPHGLLVRKLVALQLLLQPTTSDCAQSSEFTIEAEENGGVTVVARSCGDTTGAGVVSIEIFMSGDPVQSFSVPYESSAYVLDMTNDIDLDEDGAPDLSLSTGAGKGGVGTFYWLRDRTSNRYHPVGNYPTLSPCAGRNGILYSVTPGSGESISTWTYYRLSNQAMTTLLAIEVAPSINTGFLKLTPLGSTGDKGDIAPRVLESEVDTYLRGVCSDPEMPW